MTRSALYFLALLACIKIGIHVLFINQYDVFRDELYYIACSERLAWGYVDHPPLSIFFLKVTRLLTGDVLGALRLPAVLAGAGVVFLTGGIARELGAGRFGQTLAALCALVAPIYLGMNHFYSMNAFDVLFWSLAMLLVLRLLSRDRLTLWIWLGLVLGFGLLNKHSVLFFGFGLFVGLVATGRRRLLLTPGPYIAGLIALAVFAPNLWWQFANDAPTLEFMTNARLYKNTAFSPAGFIGGLVLEMHPLLAPLWIAGLMYLLFAKAAGEFRPAGIFFASLLLLFMFTGGKTYYLAAAFPVLLGAGAIVVERLDRRWNFKPLKALTLGLIVCGGVIVAPLALPVLPIRAFIAYQGFLGIGPPKQERHHAGVVPQHFADMFGWRELAAGVAAAYHSLPAAERERAVIFGRNYGFAGAIEFFGREQGLPGVVSGHNNYFLWGYGDADFDVVIAAGVREEDLREFFREVQAAGTVECEFCLPDRRVSRIFICRGLKVPLEEGWRRLKRFI